MYSVGGQRGLTSKYIHLSVTQCTLIFSDLNILPVSKGVDKSLAVLLFCLCISHDSFSCGYTSCLFSSEHGFLALASKQLEIQFLTNPSLRAFSPYCLVIFSTMGYFSKEKPYHKILALMLEGTIGIIQSNQY